MGGTVGGSKGCSWRFLVSLNDNARQEGAFGCPTGCS